MEEDFFFGWYERKKASIKEGYILTGNTGNKGGILIVSISE
jgi:hypothetical protein